MRIDDVKAQLEGLLDGCKTLKQSSASIHFDEEAVAMLSIAIQMLAKIRKYNKPNKDKVINPAKRFKTKQHNNTSGHVGVLFNKNAGKWYAKIGDGIGKYKHLGTFETIEAAVAARAKAEEEMWGLDVYAALR